MTNATLAAAVAEPDDLEMVTVKEASKLTTMSRSKLYQLMDAGLLSYFRFGKLRRLSRVELRRFIESCRVGGDRD